MRVVFFMYMRMLGMAQRAASICEVQQERRHHPAGRIREADEEEAARQGRCDEQVNLPEDDEGEELAKTSNLLLNWINLFKKVNTEESLPSELNAVLSKTPEEWFPAKPNSEVLYTLSDFNEILAEGNKEAIKDLIYLILHKNCQITELRLSSKDMYGNPYNF